MLSSVDKILERYGDHATNAGWYQLHGELYTLSLSESLTPSEHEEVQADLLAFQLAPSKSGTSHFDLIGTNPHWSEESDRPQVSPKAIQVWSDHASGLKAPLLRARFADLVWDLGRFASQSGRRDPSMGRIAVDGYLEAIHARAFEYEPYANDSLERALEISAELGDAEKIAEVSDLIISRGANAADSGQAGIWLHPAKALLHSKHLTAEQKERIRQDLEERFAQVLASEDKFAADQSIQTLLSFYPKRTRLVDRQRILRKYAVMHREAAETASPFLAVNSLLPVIELLEDHQMPDEADELRLYVEERGPQVEEEMHVVSVEQKFDADELNAMFDELLAPEVMFNALYRTARHTIPKVEKTRERLVRAQAEFPLQFLFSSVSYGHSGLPVSTTTPGKEAQEAHLSTEYGRELPLSAVFFVMAWSRAKNKFDLSSEALMAAIEGGPLIAADRRALFLDGFRAHENGDFIKSIHVLVPQVENMLRLLLRFLRIPISKRVRNRSGVTELKNMNDVLRDPRIKDTLHEDLLFFLVHLFIEKQGYNLRNDLCHGNAPTAVFNEHVSGLVIQSIILLSAIRSEHIVIGPEV